MGRQPIWLHHIGGRYRARGKHFVVYMLNNLPKKLEPGEMFNDAFDARGLDTKQVSFLGAWDSFGKVHKLPKRDLRALLEGVVWRTKT